MNAWEILMLVAGGLFSGGAIVFVWERIPVWRDQPLSQFRQEFAATLRKADRVQPALLFISTIATAAFAIGASGAARRLALVAGAGFILTLVASVAVLVPLQLRIIASSPQQAEAVEAMRRRWFLGHLGRSVLGLVSFALIAAASSAGLDTGAF